MSAHRVLHDMLRAPFRIASTTNAETLHVSRWGGVFEVTTAAAETRTLPVPTKPGMECMVVLDADGGDLTLTVTSGYNQAGDTAIVFGTAGDWAIFKSVEIGTNYRWRLVAQEGTDASVTGGGTATTLTVTDLTATSLKLAVTAVAAAGSLQTEGGDLVAGLNVVSAADNTKCVDLPTPVAGLVVAVVSATVAKTLPVFPNASSSIDNAAANAAVTIGASTAYSSAIFVADNATHWVSILGDTV